MKDYKNSLGKRGLAACLMFIMAFMLSATPLYESKVQAASEKSSGEFIKEVKLFTKKGGNISDAEAWCESQGDSWKVLKGDQDGDLNSGTSGALTKDVGVFLCYKTTTDPDEAITDLAVMNEQGNYSEGEYKDILKKQEETYKKIVADMSDMLAEYRKNVTNHVNTALQAQKFLNGYVEDDSGKLLGDFLLNASDEKLIPVLMQANGRVVLMIQEKLAYACDTGTSTWLERMEKLGSYKNLRDKALAAYKNDATKTDKALDKKYKDKARELVTSWKDVNSHIKHCQAYAKDNNLDAMNEKQYEAWVNKTKNDEDAILYRDEAAVVLKLRSYRYDGGTLVDYFMKDYAEDTDSNLRQLYPLVACMTEGQQAAVNESVSLFTMVMNASAASAFNDYTTGETKQIDDKLPSENQVMIDQAEESMNKTLDEWEKCRISIYDGVDRDVYKDGVAVTSAAKSYSSGVEKNWADVLVDSSYFRPAVIGSAIGAGLFATGAIITSIFHTKLETEMIEKMYLGYKNQVEIVNKYSAVDEQAKALFEAKMESGYKAFSGKALGPSEVKFYSNKTASEAIAEQSAEGKQQLLEKALDDTLGASEDAVKYKVLQGLKIGFTVATILLAVGDIVVTSVSLYKYYNREHLPIPHHMVDMSYNENQETSFIVYQSVPDTDGNYGDLNGDGGKQWLALYVTHDSDAGDPIMAPTKDGGEMVVKVGSSEKPGTGYSPLHMFGTPNVAQNLTFADGEGGYSFNDKNGGTYLYFAHANATVHYSNGKDEDTEEVSEDDKAEAVSGEAAGADQTGTVRSGGVNVLIGAVCALAGGFIGFVFADTRRKKMMKK